MKKRGRNLKNHRIHVPHDKSAGMSVFITLLLLAGLAGVFSSPGIRGGNAVFSGRGQSSALVRAGHTENHFQRAQEAKTLALAYYARKYGDRDVSIDIRAGGNHSEEAFIRKNGFLVKKLSISGNRVIEEHTGLHDWIFDLLTNVN
jgi:hypothetical protein